MNNILTICIILPLLAILCWTDCKYRRLPNLYTLGLAVLCIVWRFWRGGTSGLVDGLLGGCVCGLFLLIPFLMRGAGAGDLKMMFAVGIATGLHLCFAELLYVSVTGLFMGLAMMIFGKVDAVRIRHYLKCLFCWHYDREAGAAALPPRNDEKCRIPFGLAIAVGTVITLLYAYYIERPIA